MPAYVCIALCLSTNSQPAEFLFCYYVIGVKDVLPYEFAGSEAIYAVGNVNGVHSGCICVL